ncbi:MAG: hypothetical protein J3K34DRAFT_527454 [Monoraphidium minutum]|nr:MAG: hypothetical protein J3K34DRAFT_527454 [Monoraphidium minutum]
MGLGLSTKVAVGLLALLLAQGGARVALAGGDVHVRPHAARGAPPATAPAPASVLAPAEHPHTGRRFGPGDGGPVAPVHLPAIPAHHHSRRALQTGGGDAITAAPVRLLQPGPLPHAYTLCSHPPEVLSGISGRATLSGMTGGACRWLLLPSQGRATALRVDLSGLAPSDVLRLRLPRGLTVFLSQAGAARGGAGDGVWSNVVAGGEVLLEMGRIGAAVGEAAAAAPGGGPGELAPQPGEWLGGPPLMARASVVGLTWWPAYQEDEEDQARSTSATMAALGSTLGALMLLLTAGSLLGCVCRARAGGAAAGGDDGGAPPSRVPTRLRLQLKPLPYGKLGAEGAWARPPPPAASADSEAAASSPTQQLQNAAARAPAAPACGVFGCCTARSAAAEQPPALEEPRAASALAEVWLRPAPAAARAAPGAAPAGGEAPAPPGARVDLPDPADAGAGSCDPSAHGALCSICLAPFEPSSAVLVLPCGHLFHDDPCATAWLLRSRLCPVCRADVVDGISALAAGGGAGGLPA